MNNCNTIKSRLSVLKRLIRHKCPTNYARLNRNIIASETKKIEDKKNIGYKKPSTINNKYEKKKTADINKSVSTKTNQMIRKKTNTVNKPPLGRNIGNKKSSSTSNHAIHKNTNTVNKTPIRRNIGRKKSSSTSNHAIHKNTNTVNKTSVRRNIGIKKSSFTTNYNTIHRKTNAGSKKSENNKPMTTVNKTPEPTTNYLTIHRKSNVGSKKSKEKEPNISVIRTQNHQKTFVNENSKESVMTSDQFEIDTIQNKIPSNVSSFTPKHSIRKLEQRLSNKFMKAVVANGDVYRRNYNVENKMEIFT